MTRERIEELRDLTRKESGAEIMANRRELLALCFLALEALEARTALDMQVSATVSAAHSWETYRYRRAVNEAAERAARNEETP